MLKKLHILLLTLLAAVCFTVTAWADYDYIEQYGVMVTPNTEDGSLLITVKLEWTPLEALPYGQELKIGVPNGSIRDVAALTDNIERLDFDNSYMYVYLDRAYEANETFSFAYSWVQEYMYQLSTNGVIEDYDNVHYDYVNYDYTAGWFDEARIGQMVLVWNDPEGLTGDFTEGTVSGADSVTVQDGMTITASDLGYGYKMNVQVRYTDWPTQLSEEYSANNVPDDSWNGSDDYYYDDDDAGDAIIGMMVMIFVVIFIFVLISAARRVHSFAMVTNLDVQMCFCSIGLNRTNPDKAFGTLSMLRSLHSVQAVDKVYCNKTRIYQSVFSRHRMSSYTFNIN